MNKYDYVIWDFNGTLLDDVDAGIKAVNKLLDERGLRLIPSTEYYRSVFRFPIMEYYQSLGFDFEKESYEELAPEWVKLYLEYVREAKLCPYVLDVINTLREKGIKQSVLSATEVSMLTQQLKELGISHFFEETMGLDNIHAGSKLALAHEWRKNHPNDKVLFIGDTDHDVKTAEVLGADCVLVSGGHQSAEYLRTLGVKVIDDLCHILSLIREN